MGSISTPDHPLRLFLFDSPRTNCHVFYKLYSEHPKLGWGRSYHTFAGAALYGPERMQLRLRHGEQAEASQLEYANSIPPAIPATYTEATTRLLEVIEQTEQDVRGIRIGLPQSHLETIAC